MSPKPRPENLIHKTAPVFLADVDSAKGIVEAYVSVMGVLDDGDDIIHKGAFTKTITERANRFAVLDQHNTDSINRVIGKVIEIREVGSDELPAELLELYPDATGALYTKTQYLLDTPEGMGAFKRIAAGAVSEYSIGFQIAQADYSKMERDGKKVQVRNIRQIKLWEYSPVIWGMNPATMTVGVKDAQQAKEYGPDGPIERLGDSIKAGVHGTFMRLAAYYYGEGYLNADEYSQMLTLGMEMWDMLQMGIPMELGEREIVPVFFWFSADRPAEQKRKSKPVDQEDEAGPAATEPEEVQKSDEEPPTFDVEKLRREIAQRSIEIDLFELQ